MPVQILYFAKVREEVGVATEAVDVPASIATISELADWLACRSTGHAQAFANREHLRVAADQVMVTFDTPLSDGMEIAFFPPVTGG